MHKGTMKCGTPFEITSTSAVTGPDQVGGQHFGYNYTYYRINGGEWKKPPVRNQLKTLRWLESITAVSARDYEEWCGKYRLKPEAESVILEHALLLTDFGCDDDEALEKAIDRGTVGVENLVLSIFESEVK